MIVDEAWYQQVAMREEWEADQAAQREFIEWLDTIFQQFYNQEEQEHEMG